MGKRKRRRTTNRESDRQKRDKASSLERERHERRKSQSSRKGDSSRSYSSSNQRSKREYERVVVSKPSARHRIIKTLLNLVFYLLTISILVGAALFTVSKDSNKSFFGYRYYNVLTNSMIPKDPKIQKGGFQAGDIIIVQMTNPKELKKGDIVTYSLLSTETAVLTHRIKEVIPNFEDTEELYFITQGDANDAEDNPVSADRIIGKKVFTVPKVGMVLDFLRGNLLVSLGSLFSIFALIISLKYYFSYSDSPDPLK
ncbi:signal peptidase I [Vagococcus sp. BWB3-3]|uniref:Signal peptidase I n=1 Tax=Vagococcus allomyrinae TaxID=2794353 RepID=A0A940PAY9_9ENTE|nr:signal peptidase I [Vagococcus allomyrinae]MBP1042826.1 signal peptidase I [Vagococcus allomyrinae]